MSVIQQIRDEVKHLRQKEFLDRLKIFAVNSPPNKRVIERWSTLLT